MRAGTLTKWAMLSVPIFSMQPVVVEKIGVLVRFKKQKKKEENVLKEESIPIFVPTKSSNKQLGSLFRDLSSQHPHRKQIFASMRPIHREMFSHLHNQG